MAVFLQRLHHRADAIVDAADFGRNASDRSRIVDVVTIVQLPGMRLPAGKGEQLLVGIVCGMPILAVLQQQTAKRVGTVVGQKQKERFVLAGLLIDEASTACSVHRSVKYFGSLRILPFSMIGAS